MAEEGTLGLARGDNGEPSKEELQRRMEEARETITQTVTEIKETVTNQYYSMKETVSEALDWRHHFRRNPVAFSVGALSVGFLVGYGLTGALKGGAGGRQRDDYPSAEDTDVYARTGATPERYDEEARRTAFHGHSYAAQAITDGPRNAEPEAKYEPAAEESGQGESGDYGLSYASEAPRAEAEEQPQKPGLLERFKETSAYDRLQTEVASLGDRFIEELSKTAHTVVLPALFNKIKELFGVDLANKQGQGGEGQQQGRGATGAAASYGQQSGGQSSSSSSSGGGDAGAYGALAAGAGASSGASSSLASASRGSSASSYATSENRPYGSQSDEGGGGPGDSGGADNSVLDLDR